MQEQARDIEDAQNLIAELVKAIVNEPSSVRVQPLTEAGKTTFRLHLSEPDIASFHRSDDRTIRALQAILEANGKSDGHRLRLDVVESEIPDL